MPKIKSRKIFSSKTQPPANVNSSPPAEPSSVIDRSPSKISTITSLVRRSDHHYDNRRPDHDYGDPSNDYGGSSHQYNDYSTDYDTPSYNFDGPSHISTNNNDNNNGIRFSNNRRLNNNYDDRFSFPPESNTVEELNEISSESGENTNKINNDNIKETTDPVKGSMATLSQKVSQQYKELLTDFKFKHILAKRTVISTTEIEVDNYIHKYDPEEEEEDGFSDKDIEFYDFPEGEQFDIEPADDPPEPTVVAIQEKTKRIWKFKQKSVESQESSRSGLGSAKDMKRGDSTETGKSASFQNLNMILPNKSSLFKMKKSCSVDLKTVPENTEVEQQPDENPKRSHKQKFEDMCDKAKKRVNTRFEKLKQKFDTKTPTDAAPQNYTQDSIKDTNNANMNVTAKRKLAGHTQIRRDSSASEFSLGEDKNLDNDPDFYEDEQSRFPQYDDVHESTTPRCLVRRDSFDENIVRTNRAAKFKQTMKETKKAINAHRIAPPHPPKRDRSPHNQPENTYMQPAMSSFNQNTTPTKNIGIIEVEKSLKMQSEYGSYHKNAITNPTQIRYKYSQSPVENNGTFSEPCSEWVPNEKIISSIKNARYTPERQGKVIRSDVKSEWVPNKKIISAFNTTPSSTPTKSTIFAERSVRGHCRTFSETDSFIPEIYENIPVDQIVNEEDYQAWNAFPDSSSKFIKQNSVDIFNPDDETIAFDDFDDHLRNIPIIKITTQTPQSSLEPITITPIKTIPAKFKPIVKQSSITRRLSDEITTEEHVNINNLISKFEKSSKLKSKTKPMRVEATLEANNTTTSTMNKLNSNRSLPSDKNPPTDSMIMKKTKISEQVDPTTVRRIVARSSWNSSIESNESSSESESIIIRPTTRQQPLQTLPPSVSQTIPKSKIPISLSPASPSSLVKTEKSKSPLKTSIIRTRENVSPKILNNQQKQQQEQRQHLQQKMKKTEEWVGAIRIASCNNAKTDNEIYYSMDNEDGEPVHNDSSNLSSIHSNLDDDPDDDSIIKLRLKKPPGWNWELSTSKSSPNIAFPRILLYDDKGDLLADAKEADCIFTGSKNNNNNNEYYFQRSQSTKSPRSSSVSTDGKRAASISSSSIKSKYKERRSSSTNLKEINECLDDIVDRLKNHGIDYKLRHNPNSQSRVGSNERKLKRYDSYNTISKGNDVNGLESCEGNINETNDRIRTRRNSIHTILEDAVSNNDNTTTTITSTNPDNTTKTSINVNTTTTTNNSNNNKLEKLEDNESRKSDEVSEIPIFVYSAKGLIRRDLNSKEFDHIRKRYKKSLTSNLEDVQLKDSLTRSKLLEDDDVKKVQVKTSATNYNNNKNNQNNNNYNIDSPKLIDKSLTPVKEVRFDLQKSKSAVDCTGGREKKKCRRSSASDPTRPSGSILERMSMFKRRSSSTDSQDIEITNVNHGPRYYLRTSNAGTLVVCEESIRDRKIRRRSKTCSRISENDEGSDPKNTLRLGTSREKLIQKYLYLGTSTETGDNNDNKNDSNFLNSNKNKDPNRYDKAIAKIDKLISRESLRRTDKSQLFLRNSPRNSLNLSENNTSSNNSNNNSYKLKKSASGTVFNNNHRNISHHNKSLSKDNNNLSYSSNDRNSFLSVPSDRLVNDHHNQKRDQSVTNSNDTKVKRRKKLKQLRRCASAGAINNDISSSSSSDDDTKTEPSPSPRTRGRSKLATSRETLQKPYGKSSSDLCTRYGEIMSSSSRPPKSPHVKQAPIIRKI